MGLPRVTQILKQFGFIRDITELQFGDKGVHSRHLRRGRLVDYACNLVGQGLQVEGEWWKRASGSPDPRLNDWIAHEDCRPYINSYTKALEETGGKLLHWAFEVVNPVVGYVGHCDQVWMLDGREASVELKCGKEEDWHALQSGAYLPGIIAKFRFVPRRYNLYLTEESYKLVRRDDPRDVKEFEALARAYHVLKRREVID